MSSSPGLETSDFYKAPSNWKQRVFSVVERLTSAARVEDTILVSGTGRSGSTWVGELLRELPGYTLLNEPFMHTPLSKRTYVSPGATVPSLYAFVERALTGRLGRSWRWSLKSETAGGRLLELIGNQKTIVKCTRGLRITHWMTRAFDVRETVLLMRHPCAVVSSMLQHGGWNDRPMGNRGETPADRVLGRNVPVDLRNQLQSHLGRIEHRFETLAYMWALDYYLAFFEEPVSTFPWILVPYERLVSQQGKELRRILSALGEDMSPDLRRRMGVASSSASKSLATQDSSHQLSKWKRHLTSDQIDRVLEITHSFGIDWYTEDPEPDYEKLNSFQRPTASW